MKRKTLLTTNVKYIKFMAVSTTTAQHRDKIELQAMTKGKCWPRGMKMDDQITRQNIGSINSNVLLFIVRMLIARFTNNCLLPVFLQL